MFASKEEFRDRLEICDGCEFGITAFNKFRVKGIGCKKCNCFMNLKAKLKGMKCPVGKW